MSDKIPLLDLHAQFKPLEEEIRSAIDRVLASQHFILGPEVEAFEKEVAAYTHNRFAVGVSSGSDALLMCLMVLNIGPGDEVITSPYTFFATVGAVSRLGAKTVFVDIDPKTYNLDPSKLERAITPKTKAIIPVHLYGQSAEMNPILEVCARRNIPLIEDAAQAIGTEYQGKRIGTLGKMACFSFFPSKNLGALGDGGMVTTDDEDLAKKLRIFRAHGSSPKYFHKYVGGNFRLDALQAAVLRVKLPKLDGWTEGRIRNADRYDRMFKESGLNGTVTMPWRRPGDRHIFNQYVIRVPRRDEFRKYLDQSGIGNEVYYPLPMHLQECFASLGYHKGDFPESERAANESVAIPVYPELTEVQQSRIVETVVRFLKTT